SRHRGLDVRGRRPGLDRVAQVVHSGLRSLNRNPVSALSRPWLDFSRFQGVPRMLTLDLTGFVTHLQTPTEPLRIRRSGELAWPDEQQHARAYAADPVGYALLALVPGVPPSQRARVLLRILDASWAELSVETRATLNRVARVLTLGLPATACVPVVLALRHRRANHKHVTRAILRLLLEHPQADSLVGTHRAVLVACFEHALGKATARGWAKALMDEESTVDLVRPLLRFAPDPVVAADRVRALYTPGRAG